MVRLPEGPGVSLAKARARGKQHWGLSQDPPRGKWICTNGPPQNTFVPKKTPAVCGFHDGAHEESGPARDEADQDGTGSGLWGADLSTPFFLPLSPLPPSKWGTILGAPSLFPDIPGMVLGWEEGETWLPQAGVGLERNT